MTFNNIGLVGFGEVGKGLFETYIKNGIEIKILDRYLDIDDNLEGVELLNICIPYSSEFVEIVNTYIECFKPQLTVIHSSVVPGTTKKIIGNVCHSPIRGLHPNLDKGIQTFTKFIGSEDLSVSQIYQNHLSLLGINSFICKNSLTSEFAKLLDTTYYGLCIAFHNDVNTLCEENDLEFTEVMTIFNQSYNKGYKDLGKENVIRPVLYPSDKIGGHCILPNALLLKDYMDSILLDGILKYS